MQLVVQIVLDIKNKVMVVDEKNDYMMMDFKVSDIIFVAKQERTISFIVQNFKAEILVI